MRHWSRWAFPIKTFAQDVTGGTVKRLRACVRKVLSTADNSAWAGYVHGESVETMKDAIEKLRFDGFALRWKDDSN
jgi:hypothetical protein